MPTILSTPTKISNHLRILIKLLKISSFVSFHTPYPISPQPRKTRIPKRDQFPANPPPKPNHPSTIYLRPKTPHKMYTHARHNENKASIPRIPITSSTTYHTSRFQKKAVNIEMTKNEECIPASQIYPTLLSPAS